LLICLPALLQAAVDIEVIVKGVDPPLYDNVMSGLKIDLQKDSERLQENSMYRLHRRAPEDIREALAPFGYYNPQIKASLKELDGVWQAEYQIDKGPPMLVSSVDIRLTGAGRNNRDLEDGLSKFSIVAGEILDQVRYESDKKKLINLAMSEGFLDANFSLKKLLVDKSNNSAEVQLTLNTGPRYLFGKTTSLEHVLRPELLQGYLPYKEGDPYSMAKLFELQSILYQTDYFSRVEVKGNRALATDLSIPVEIDLSVPEKLNEYNLGVGYGTDTGLRGKIDWSNRLFNDRGHTIHAILQLAQYENILSLSYKVPLENPRYDKMVSVLAYQDKSWDTTNTRLITGAIAREHSGPKFKYAFGLEIRSEVYDIGYTSGESTLLVPSANGGLIMADNILDTKNGLQVSVGLRGALEGAVSDTSFLQGTIGGKAIISPLKKVRLIGRLNFGATLVDDIDSLPPSLRFYTGGDNSIRGYSYKSIAPKDITGTVIGGRYLVVQSIEIERLMNEYWSLAAFWDGGTATDDLSLAYYQGAGAGVRFRLPFGQIRLDLASAITEDGRPWRVEFYVGADL
jgi:translocation and assembly module TamA